MMPIESWFQQYESHSVWDAVRNARAVIGALEPGLDALDGVDYISSVLAAVEKKSNQPTLLVSRQMLDNLESAVTSQVHVNLSNWVSSGNSAYLQNATTGMHQVLEAIRGWPVSDRDSIRSAGAITREASKATERAIASLSTMVQDQREEIESVIEQYKTNASETGETILAQLRQATTDLTSLENGIVATKTRNDILVNTLQDRFDSSMKSWNEHFQHKSEDEEDSFAALLIRFEEQHTTVLNKACARGSEWNTQLAQLVKKVEDTVGAVGTTATAKWYEDEGLAQKGAADFWRWAAVIGFGLAIAWSVFWLTLLQSPADEWRLSASRGLLTLSIIGFATFATSESRNHRKDERKAKSTELRLRAFDPFIATLPEKERQRLKTETSRYIFLNQLSEPDLAYNTHGINRNPDDELSQT